jgi:hypothetical protein
VAITNLAGAASLSSNAVLTVWPTATANSDNRAINGLRPAPPAPFDTDGDSATNAEEYLSGTDPHDPLGSLRLEYIRANGPNLWTVGFLAVSNRTYTLVGRGGFSLSNSWLPVSDVLAAPTNRNVEIIQLPIDFMDQQFFRLLTPRSR